MSVVAPRAYDVFSIVALKPFAVMSQYVPYVAEPVVHERPRPRSAVATARAAVAHAIIVFWAVSLP